MSESGWKNYLLRGIPAADVNEDPPCASGEYEGRSPLSPPPDPLVERQIDRDPAVVALRRRLAVLERARLRLLASIATERVEALWRICKRVDAANLARGAVMPAEVRAQLSEAVDLHGLDFAAGKLGVSPRLLEQLVAGIPVPIGWTELPEEQAAAAE